MSHKQQRTPGRRYRQYTPEFKLEAVRLLTSGAKSAKEVAQELGIRADMLRKWRSALASHQGAAQRPPTPRSSVGREAFPGQGHLTSVDEENRQLRRQIAVLTEEREILKKATAFFAKQSR